MKFDTFSNLSNQFREEGLPTYSEVIRGLPGETLETFKDGLEQLVGESKIDNNIHFSLYNSSKCTYEHS